MRTGGPRNKCRAGSSIEPEIETRPGQEIVTCEGSLGATGQSATDITSLFTSADKPEVFTTHTSKEAITTSLFTAPSQTSPPHTGSQPGIIFSTGRSSTSSDVSGVDTPMPTLSYHGDVPITGSFAPARASIRDTTVVPLSASARDALAKAGGCASDVPRLGWIQPPCHRTVSLS